MTPTTHMQAQPNLPDAVDCNTTDTRLAISIRLFEHRFRSTEHAYQYMKTR